MNGAPSSVARTIVPLPPDASGSAVWSRSVTSAVGVPGIEKLLASVPPNATNAAPASTSTASHAARTVRARRAHARPRR
ncbi:Uncharacterised protein [Mycobacteroides abscessus]|nr:Uncharacterised protein [Mycobacteroides abscessus]